MGTKIKRIFKKISLKRTTVLILVFVIFLLVKGMNALASLGHRKDTEAEVPAEKTCPFCYSKIDIKATRCPHCTSVIETLEMEAEKED